MVSKRALVARLIVAATLLAPTLPSGALAAAEVANAAIKPPEPRETPLAPIARPDFLRMPSRQQMEQQYPDRAARLELAGRVTMDCVATETGAMKDCSVTSETPTGLGFAAAALRMARYYQLRPTGKDGVSVAGRKVTVDIPFDPK